MNKRVVIIREGVHIYWSSICWTVGKANLKSNIIDCHNIFKTSFIRFNSNKSFEGVYLTRNLKLLTNNYINLAQNSHIYLLK